MAKKISKKERQARREQRQNTWQKKNQNSEIAVVYAYKTDEGLEVAAVRVRSNASNEDIAMDGARLALKCGHRPTEMIALNLGNCPDEEAINLLDLPGFSEAANYMLDHSKGMLKVMDAEKFIAFATCVDAINHFAEAIAA